MPAAIKAFIVALRKRKLIKTIVGAIIAICAIILLFISPLDYNGDSSALADAAKYEYNYWEGVSPTSVGYSCQGEKYCNHFNTSVVDWCCYFVGYCIEQTDLKLTESGFSPRVCIWIENLKKANKIKDADGYTPQIGNLIFFNYNGRSHYKTTNYAHHIGIVVDTDGEKITVIAGNEYNGYTSNWSSVSKVNRYVVNLNSNNIACYGTIGTNKIVTSTHLNTTVRDVICHNEVGILYSEVTTQYGNVISNDNGAITCGVLGWHGNRALDLLKKAYQLNKSEVKQILNSFNDGGIILNAINTNKNWSNYIPTKNESICIKAVLLSSSGKEAQDTLSLEEAQEYIDLCKDNGLSDSKVIIYCCDIVNQYGNNSFKPNIYGAGKHGVLYGLEKNVTLDEIYNSQRAWKDNNHNYHTRRKWTYEYLKEAL